MGYEVVIPARNEEKYIEKTLLSISNQSLPPDKIIVVNDGSIDNTSLIAKKYANDVIDLPDRGYNALGTSEIPKVINKGLEQVTLEAEYVLICGADAVIPPNYFEVILEKMEEDKSLVIASGRLENDLTIDELHPRGTRVVRADFWRNINGLRYPEDLGWESWLIFKALQIGKKVKRIPHLITMAQRSPAKTKLKKAWNLGRVMRSLGYDWKYALARCVRYFFKSPTSGINMISGYISTNNKEYLDVANWVGQNQRGNLLKQIYKYIKIIASKRNLRRF